MLYPRTQLKFPRGKRDDRGRFRLAFEMVAGENRAIRGRKGAEMSVLGTTLPPAIGAYRGGAEAADRPVPTVATGFTHRKKYAQSQMCGSYKLLYGLLNCDWAYFFGCVNPVATVDTGRSATSAPPR